MSDTPTPTQPQTPAQAPTITPLYDAISIAARVQSMGQEITEAFTARGVEELTLIVVMTGGMPFAADLMRAVQLPQRVRHIVASSYHGGTQSTGAVQLREDIEYSVRGQHVLLVDDIVDTGRTATRLTELFTQEKLGAASVSTACFLDKPERREVAFKADFVGFEIPNEFVIGYGMDYEGLYRELPYIGIYKG